MSAGEFGRHAYLLTTLLGPLIGPLLLWRLARLDQALDEVVQLRADHELGPLLARALSGALAAVLAIVLGVCGAGLVQLIGQPFTWSGWLYALAYLVRSLSAMLVWTGLASVGIAAARSPWGAFTLPLLVWVVAFAAWLPETVSYAARILVLTDAGVVSPMTPWGIGFGSAVAWVGAFLLAFLGLLGLAATIQRVHRRTSRAGTAVFTLLCWGVLPLYLAALDPLRMEMAIKGDVQTSYPVTLRSEPDPGPAEAGMETLTTGAMVLHRPAGKPVPDELLPVYRTVLSWVERASWETGIADVWVVPDFGSVPNAASGGVVDGSNLIIHERWLRRFRVADRLSIALRLTEPLQVNRPARIYLALWLVSGGQEGEIRPLLAFLERYMTSQSDFLAADWETALSWGVSDDEIKRLSGEWAAEATKPVEPGRPDSSAELRQRDVMFSMLHRWNPAFHMPYQFSALEARLVLRHWGTGREQGHQRYIADRLAELEELRGAR
ncbi:putative Tic20 family protein [Symbiobacterium terraclitae]|uniref:Tic20 family protein n=1 Tax=Symbiobacterium terraclitae TaxID=557451 RepID=A0ABS4JTA9_9FIRM|nr:hypothetical protein [Symbiobacterium terraclitae]MBP2018777.1 putative Tic20 family protein [Symbiobacterium terraclitae]